MQLESTYLNNKEHYYNPNRGPDRRRRPSGVRTKTWKVTNIQAIHHEIIRMLHIGNSNVFIAKALNISAQMVTLVKNSPAVVDKLKILEKASDAKTVDVKAMILDKAPDAVRTLHELMDKEETTPTLRVKIAMDQLDRAGHSPIRQIASQQLHMHRFVTDDDIVALKKRAIELMSQDGTIIDQP